MHHLDPLWLLLAGFGAGLCGSVAGLASLVSYPTLLALGIPPVSANVTNTVALVFNSVGSVWGSRPELRGQRERARALAVVALAGGLCGALLLLATPSGEFARIVPWLIGLASIAILYRRTVPSLDGLESAPPAVPGRPDLPERPDPSHLPGTSERSTEAGRFGRWRWRWHRQAAPSRLVAGVFLVAVYAGFFGAGAGVVVLSLLLLLSGEDLPRSAALKNLLMGLANLVAAITFAAFGPVRWWAVLPLAAGCLAGGRLGPVIIRRAPDRPLRLLIACAGLGLAVHLGLDAYR